MFKAIRRIKNWATLHYTLLVLLLLFSIHFSGSDHPLRLGLQHGVFDQFNKIHPREPSGEVIVVDIDEKSLDEYGQWPWPRHHVAKLVRNLSGYGAKVIAFDGVFGEEDRSSPRSFLKNLPKDEAAIFAGGKKIETLPDYDEDLAQAIKDSQIFVGGFTYGRTDRTDSKPENKNRLLSKPNVKASFVRNASYFDAAAVNIPILSEPSAGNGSFMARPDSDGVLRRVGMVFSDGKDIYPSLSLESLRVAKLGRKGMVRLADVPLAEKKLVDTDYRIVLGDYVIPVDSDGILYVHYRPFCRDRMVRPNGLSCTSDQDYISARDVLDAGLSEQIKARVENKIILVGASAEGLKDLRSTPLEPFRPGVEVHANVIEQILQGKYLLRPAMTQNVEAAYILFAGLFFILVSPFVGVLISVALCATIMALSVFGAYYVYVVHSVLVDPVYPSLCVLAIFIVSTILSYARAESRRKRIRDAFGMYVAGDVMRDLERNPEKLKLGGESRNLSVMFTDIRQFTKISEDLQPEELIVLMNEFLTAMTEIVMNHQGTVDKYIGDAMMAFWNAPRDIENHERSACLAALKMQSALEPVNKRIAERNTRAEEGKAPVLLRAGIGINTGICAVGNMGSRQRFAYSALGDAVNLAARLEGQTKYYGVDILVGETTFHKAHDLAALELDLIRVVGKSHPVRIYVLLGDHDMAASDGFQEWKILHDRMLSHYRNREFDEAYQSLRACKKQATENLFHFYDLYAERIVKLKKIKLPDDWDGVFIALEK